MNYNNVRSVDRLIEEFERSNVHTQEVTNKKIDAEVAKRKRKLEELKKLRDELESQEKYGETLSKLKSDNDTLDSAINDIKITLGKKPKQTKNASGESRYSGYYDYGESRSGESNW